eukprot:6233370-Amphidinium_carterae.1
MVVENVARMPYLEQQVLAFVKLRHLKLGAGSSLSLVLVAYRLIVLLVCLAGQPANGKRQANLCGMLVSKLLRSSVLQLVCQDARGYFPWLTDMPVADSETERYIT